jgi:hypothetical protein
MLVAAVNRCCKEVLASEGEEGTLVYRHHHSRRYDP